MRVGRGRSEPITRGKRNEPSIATGAAELVNGSHRLPAADCDGGPVRMEATTEPSWV